jgi:hypothetical protein
VTTLQTTEIDQAREYLNHTWNRVVEVTKCLSDTQWKFKPAPDRWSIAENLEHMVIVQERVLGPVREQLAQAPPPPAGTETGKIDSIVLERIPDRSIKAKAPAFIEPTGNWTSDATLARFFRNHARLLEFVESTPDLRAHCLESPPLKFVTNGEYTAMDGYQFVLTVAGHNERHVRQIEEVKADPHYPRAQSSESAAVA